MRLIAGHRIALQNSESLSKEKRMYDGKQITILNGDAQIDVQFIRSQCYAKPEDIVIVGGTLIEGIGNWYSDIDVYVLTNSLRSGSSIELHKHHRVISTNREIIGPESDDKEVLLTHTVVPGTYMKIDVEFKTLEQIESLLARVRAIYEYACENLILLTMRLSEREEDLLNRLFRCIPIQNEGAFDALMRGIAQRQVCYLAYRWVASDFAVVLDLIGAWHRGEIDRATDIARENVLSQMTGLLHLMGVTNMRRKWLPTLVANSAAIPPDVRSRFMDLFYFRGTETLEGKQLYVRYALDLVDEIFTISRHLLENDPNYPSGPEALQRLGNARQHVPSSAYAEMEYSYRARVYAEQGFATQTLLGAFGVGA